MHARSLGGLAASWKRRGYAMAEVKRAGAQANRAAAAVVGVVVAHRCPLIQWREVPLSPSQSQHSPSPLPPLHPLSSLFPPLLSPHGVGRGSHSLTHSLTHTLTHTCMHAPAHTITHTRRHSLSHTHTHTHTHPRVQWLNSGRLSDRAHAGRISPSCRRSSPLWLSPLFCVCASECVCACVCIERERERERERD